ncbi:MAG: hypothetical protein QXL53_02690 [Acidilobaceae archaeon]
MNLVLLTNLKHIDVEVLRKLEELKYNVSVIKVSDFRPENIARLLGDMEFDYAVIPGSSPYDYSNLHVRVVKGPISIYTLPYILSVVSIDNLSPKIHAEKVLGDKMKLIIDRVYNEIIDSYTGTFTIGGLRIPKRPPPILVASDIYYDGNISVDSLVDEANYRVSEGADFIVLSSNPSIDKVVYLKVLEALMDNVEAAIAADPGRIDTLIEAVEMGAPIAMSLTTSTLEYIPRHLRDVAAYVIIPERISSWRSRLGQLRKAYEKAVSLGYNMVIIDPIVNPPIYPGVLESFITAREASKTINAPLMLGLNNAIEMADIDTHASTALLIYAATEAGVSIVMVGEESYKARGNTREARIAAKLASVSYKLKTPPKDLGYDILRLKGKGPAQNVEYLGHGLVDVNGLRIDCRRLEDHKYKHIEEDTQRKILEACIPWI